MTDRLGPESDLTTKQILLNIEDDTEFMNACQTSKRMRDVCSHQDLWEERLKMYYPQTVPTKIRTGLTWRQFYPIASLFNQYVKLYDRLNEGEANIDPVIALLLKRIGRYLTNFVFDYSMVLSNNFVELFNKDYGLEDDMNIIVGEFLTVASAKNLIDQTKRFIQLLKEQKLRGFQGPFTNYLNNGTNDFIISVLYGQEIWNYYTLLIRETKDQERIKDYIIKAVRKVESTALFRDIMAPDILVNTGEIADWALNFFESNPLLSMTDYIFVNIRNGRGIDQNIYVYIVSRNMHPVFEYILPTKTILDHIRNHGQNFEPVHMIRIYELVKTLATGRIFPSPSSVDQIPQEIRERYKSRYDFFVELSKRYK